MVGVSATIIEISKIKKEEFDKSSFSITEQQMLDEWTDVSKLGLPKTVIIKLHTEGEFIHYKVSMSSETIKKPIYIFEEGYKEYNKGYQTIENFTFWLKKDKSMMIIFAPKLVANLFIRKLKRKGSISSKNIIFDFSKIEQLENMDSAWGFWQDSQGVVKRIAKFGKGCNTVVDDFSSITTFYIDYMYGAEIIQLILGKNGSISTNNDISKRDLYIVYKEIVGVLKS